MGYDVTRKVGLVERENTKEFVNALTEFLSGIDLPLKDIKILYGQGVHNSGYGDRPYSALVIWEKSRTLV